MEFAGQHRDNLSYLSNDGQTMAGIPNEIPFLPNIQKNPHDESQHLVETFTRSFAFRCVAYYRAQKLPHVHILVSRIGAGDLDVGVQRACIAFCSKGWF